MNPIMVPLCLQWNFKIPEISLQTVYGSLCSNLETIMTQLWNCDVNKWRLDTLKTKETMYLENVKQREIKPRITESMSINCKGRFLTDQNNRGISKILQNLVEPRSGPTAFFCLDFHGKVWTLCMRISASFWLSVLKRDNLNWDW